MSPDARLVDNLVAGNATATWTCSCTTGPTARLAVSGRRPTLIVGAGVFAAMLLSTLALPLLSTVTRHDALRYQ